MKNSMQVSEWRRVASAEVASEDADALLQFVTGWNPTQLIIRSDDTLSEAQLRRLSECIERRRRGEPVAYITGSRGFWSLDLHVNEHTLIPRADTETLVEAALRVIEGIDQPKILDLGTGSGAIALAIANERKDATVIATDRSAEALDTAARNAQRLMIRNVCFMQGDWFGAFASAQSFDLIVSNPPYIREDDEHLQRGDLRFEPRSALSSGVDGLDDIRAITARAGDFLKTGGWLILEHGYDQALQVQALMEQHAFIHVRTVRDFGGNDRVTCAQRA